MKTIMTMMFILLFAGCGDDDGIYTKFYQKDISLQGIKSVKLEGDNYYLLDKVEHSLKKYDIHSVKNSKYIVKLYSHYVISCANPVMHAIPADFNGYMGLSFFVGKNEIYRVQKDFRGKVDNDIVDMVVKRMIKDLKLTSKMK